MEDQGKDIEMQTLTAIVGTDGRVEIPGTEAGQTVTIHIESAEAVLPRRLSAEERDRIIHEQLAESQQTRASANPEKLAQALNHGEWLYGPDGLPR